MKKRTKYILLAILGLWVLILAVFTVPNLVALHSEKASVEGVYTTYTQDLVDKQFDKAYELCGPDFRSQLSMAQFAEQQKRFHQEFGRLLSAKQQGYKISGTGRPVFWTAQISANLTYEKGVRRFEFAFRKQDGKWVLYGYQEEGEVGRG